MTFNGRVALEGIVTLSIYQFNIFRARACVSNIRKSSKCILNIYSYLYFSEIIPILFVNITIYIYRVIQFVSTTSRDDCFKLFSSYILIQDKLQGAVKELKNFVLFIQSDLFRTRIFRTLIIISIVALVKLQYRLLFP